MLKRGDYITVMRGKGDNSYQGDVLKVLVVELPNISVERLSGYFERDYIEINLNLFVVGKLSKKFVTDNIEEIDYISGEYIKSKAKELVFKEYHFEESDVTQEDYDKQAGECIKSLREIRDSMEAYGGWDFTLPLDRYTTKEQKVETKKEEVKVKEKIMFNYSYVNVDHDLERIEKRIKKTGRTDFSMCLYGVAGSGKSQWAKKLASEMGLEFKKIRYSDLADRYVGSSEQNISKMFKEATDKKQFILIDEADSLLSDRENANQSWEVSQVNEMLTWLEDHKYPVVFTTNLRKNMDKAMQRRITFNIMFDFLDVEKQNKMIQDVMKRPLEVTQKGITIGDCVNVKKKVDILGERDPAIIEDYFIKEIKLKDLPENRTTTKIGFEV